MGSSSHAGEMCLEGRGGRAGMRGAGKKAAEQKAAARQPQRGLGVAQLEKIRLHNQMMVAYRSGGLHPPPQPQQVPFAVAVAVAGGAGASPFQPYLPDCFEAMDRRIVEARYYENLLPFSSSRPPATRLQPPPPPLFVHDVKDSSGQRQQQPQYYWMSSSHESSHGLSSAGSSEELDLELRL